MAVTVSQVKVHAMSVSVLMLPDVDMDVACKRLGPGWVFTKVNPRSYLRSVWEVYYNNIHVACIGTQPSCGITGGAYTHLYLYARCQRALRACPSVVAWRLMHALWPKQLGRPKHPDAPARRKQFIGHVRVTQLGLGVDVHNVAMDAFYTAMAPKAWADRMGHTPAASRWYAANGLHGRVVYYCGNNKSARVWCVRSTKHGTRVELRLKAHAYAPLDAAAILLGRAWANLLAYDAPYFYKYLQATYPNAMFEANAQRNNAYANLPLRQQKRGTKSKARDAVATVCHIMKQYKNVLPLLLVVLLCTYGAQVSMPVDSVVKFAKNLNYDVPSSNSAWPKSVQPVPVRLGLSQKGLAQCQA